MKKRIIAISVIAAFGITSFLACNKKNIEINQGSTSPTGKVVKMPGGGVLTDAAANLSNPFDNIGYEHNIALQATRSVWINPSTTTQAGYSAVASYCASQGFANTTSFATISDMVARVNSDHTVGETTYVSGIGLSSAASAYAVQIFTAVNQVSNYASYDDFKNAVMQIESAISSNTQLNSNERQRLLTDASVARHSLLYWSREAAGYNADPSTSGNPNGVVAFGFWGNIKAWFNRHPIIKADCAGALGGVATGLQGALIGAATGSVVEWLF